MRVASVAYVRGVTAPRAVTRSRDFSLTPRSSDISRDLFLMPRSSDLSRDLTLVLRLRDLSRDLSLAPRSLDLSLASNRSPELWSRLRLRPWGLISCPFHRRSVRTWVSPLFDPFDLLSQLPFRPHVASQRIDGFCPSLGPL